MVFLLDVQGSLRSNDFLIISSEFFYSIISKYLDIIIALTVIHLSCNKFVHTLKALLLTGKVFSLRKLVELMKLKNY